LILNQTIKELIIDFLTDDNPDIELIIIFGSLVNNTYFHEKSDIDIAFLSFSGMSNIERWNIQEKLASKLDIDIDLVDMYHCDDVLRFEITHKGQVNRIE